MLDRADSCRPERRSALIAHELSRLNIDIAALSEVRFSGEGSLQEHGAGYTLYWSGKPETERRLSGVGFMVRNSIASKLENQPTGHSDRIITMRLPLWNQQYATLFSVYSTQTPRALSLLLGAGQTITRSPWCSHHHPVQEQRGKVKLRQLPGDNSALHRRKNSRKDTAQQTGAHHRWRQHPREPVWLQTKQEHYRHGVRPQTSARKMQGAK